MRLRRKNLFLTILNNDGDIISKTNIGSCGFKKRVKFTGFALQNTMRIFAEKIIKILQDD
jgi:ribosomal protein S11